MTNTPNQPDTDRDAPHQPHAYRQGKPVRGVVEYDASEVVDYTGAGFLYASTYALREIGEPWFDWNHKLGEDAYFCRKAREKSFETWYYPYVTLGHVGTTMFSDPQYEQILRKVEPRTLST